MAKKDFLSTLNACLLILLIVVIVFSTYSVIHLFGIMKPKAPAPLPQVELKLIAVSDCEQCFNVAQIEDYVKQLPNINLTKTITIPTEDMEEVKELISDYELARLPAAIISGETKNLSIENFAAKKEALVFDTPPAPYYDTATSEIVGKVAATIITDKTCTQCTNISTILTQLKSLNVFITSTRTLDASSSEAKKLIDKYKIEKTPTVLFSQDAMAYDIFQQAWKQVGTTEQDGTLVMRTINPPYKEIKTNNVKGIVTATYLTDKSCTNCTNATIYKQIIESNLGIQFEKETTLDIGSSAGKKIIEKYNISIVPTIILSAEAEAYPAFTTAWEQVGTEEKDGVFVFRNVGMLEGVTYKNLTSQQVGTGGADSGED